MALQLVITLLLSQYLYVSSFTMLDRYYARFTREDPGNPFHSLDQARFIEDDSPEPAEDESNGESIRFIVAPVQMSNPLYSFISRAGQLYSVLLKRAASRKEQQLY
ncbi:unnamed protein product [Cylicocyclus nassatus]|uniref:Uncharacterized protein n=1 Tax=Cylicocyclus nassatus TaxID=53992 RepID=A0AA36GVG0_CYLNA|nr:unnamed protein product [Cylicocyclus nassatus]